jgi:hypothetical protein
MTIEQFNSTLPQPEPPAGITDILTALWYAGKGDWEKAHSIAQDISTRDGSWIHAYLHRYEGDQGNAHYWYNKAGRTMPVMSLEMEWEALVKAFL